MNPTRGTPYQAVLFIKGQKMNTLKNIIHTFLHNPMPEALQRQFQAWCLRKEDAEEKDELLWQEWQKLDPASMIPADEAGYRRKLAHLRLKIAAERSKKFFQLSGRSVAAAAAAVLLLVTGEFFAVRHLSKSATTCLVTAENSKGRFTLPDGSVVWLNADSKLSYSDHFTRSGVRSVELEGEAFFDVRHDSLHPFEVEMGKLKVTVLGTRFNASHLPAFNTEEVTLQSGRVEVSGFRAEPVVLSPNQSCAYDPQSDRVSVKEVQSSNYCSWTGDSIVFDDMALKDILTNLEHWYNVRFRIGEGVDTSMRISFTLRPETLEETLAIIGTLTHLQYRQTDKLHVTIHKK